MVGEVLQGSAQGMRNISFMLTTQQIRDRTKTVTRRLGWCFLKPGDRLQGCVKCQGIKKGEKMEKLAVIEVVSIRRESLWDMSEDDCAKEGFPEMHPHEFVEMFCDNMSVGPGEYVNRIEFKYVD